MTRDNRDWGLHLLGRERLGANVMVRRLRTGMSRPELCASAAISIARLGQVEDGKAAGTLDVWVRIAGTLDESLDDLLAGVRWVPVPPESRAGEGSYLVRREEA
jgi:hypothetical protein